MVAMAQNIVMEMAVYYKPVNRYIQINIPEVIPPTTESGIVLPDDFNPKAEHHVIASVVSWAEDVRFAKELKEGIEIVVNNSMIEKITVKEGQLSVVQDNYIIAILI